MPITPVTAEQIPSRRDAPDDFSDKGDALLGRLPGIFDEMNTLEENVSEKATIATTKAGDANDSATLAAEKEALVSPHYAAIDSVAANEANINTAAADIGNVNTVAEKAADVTTVAVNIAAVGITSANVGSVSTVAVGMAAVITVATNIVDIQNAVQNAAICTTKAGEAAASAEAAKLFDPSNYYPKAEVDDKVALAVPTTAFLMAYGGL